MIINKLDLGNYNPFKLSDRGMHTGIVEIPGGYAVPYGDHSDPDSWRAHIWIKAPAAVGSFTAGSQGAAEFLSRQLEELARNPDQQPVYVQLFAGTGTTAHSPAFNEPQDGFYYLRARVDYTHSLQGFTEADLDLTYVSPGPPRSVGVSMAGGALSTGFGGSITNWCAFPFNATIPLTDATRTGAEGAIKVDIAPFLNPAPFVPSATFADWYKGGCQAHDVMAAIGTNAVPVDGTNLNVNWIEVFGKDHRFTGDVILTNGLHLWTLALTASPGITGYVWNTNLGPPAWQQFCTLGYADDGANVGTLRQVTVQRVSLEEVRADCWLSTAAGAWSRLTIRLQRGAYHTRLEFTPMAETNTIAHSLRLTTPTTIKAVYNATNMKDEATNPSVNLATDPTFGYAAIIIANSSYPFLSGLLWQDTTTNQPFVSGTTLIGVGDTGGPAQNATKQYGVFAFPYATPQNLVGEAEGGTLGTGWSSVADAAQSGGNVAKCLSGTLTGNADTFGTAFVPGVGAYDVWFLVKVTSAAGSASEMKLGLYNSTDSVFVGSTTYKANDFTTSYSWKKVVSGVTPTAAKNMRFRAETTATIGTDWFIDLAVLAPTTSTSSYSFPQDNWSQFEYDRSTRIRIQ